MKTEASDAGPAVAPAEASSAKEEMKADPDQDPGQGEELQLVSTNVFQKTGLVYHTNGGKLEEVALHAGPDGFWWATSSDGKKIATTLPCSAEGEGVTAGQTAAEAEDAFMEGAGDGVAGHEAAAEAEDAFIKGCWGWCCRT